MKLSIIVPVWNGEKWLRKCIESIMTDAANDWQLIIVDDGSSDTSGAIADKFATADARITTIHKENGGLSSARNAGIEIASGEYITFVDADDTLETGTLNAVLAEIELHPEWDFVEYPVRKSDETEKRSTSNVQCSTSNIQRSTFNVQCSTFNVLDYWFDQRAYTHSYACNKIYKRHLFNEVRFPEGKVFEDIATLPEILKRCNHVGMTDKGCYNYYVNASGITQTAGAKELTNLLEAHLRLIGTPFGADRNEDYYARVLNIQLDVCDLTGCRPTLPVCKFNGTTKLKLMHLLGLNNLCRLHRIIKPLKICKKKK